MLTCRQLVKGWNTVFSRNHLSYLPVLILPGLDPSELFKKKKNPEKSNEKLYKDVPGRSNLLQLFWICIVDNGRDTHMRNSRNIPR